MRAGTLALVALLGSAGGQPVARGEPAPFSSLRPAETLCGLTAASAGDFEAQVARLPGIEHAPDEGGYGVYFDNTNMRIWNFTTAQIPGHPAAICRTIVPKGSGSEIRTEISCGGDKADCAAIAESFDALHKRIFGQ